MFGWLIAVAALVLGTAACAGDDEASDPGVVEVAAGEDIQIRSLAVLTGLGDLGTPSQRGVALALEDYGPIKGHNVSMGAGLDSLCTAEGGQAAAETVVGDPRRNVLLRSSRRSFSYSQRGGLSDGGPLHHLPIPHL